mmetsp:Transcript_10783/g.40328  ORF Transcript_10783/g.40328 Transcript_10783/m.40328 type:complete len:93 (-) Transcript_10783:360-638(-)
MSKYVSKQEFDFHQRGYAEYSQNPGGRHISNLFLPFRPLLFLFRTAIHYQASIDQRLSKQCKKGFETLDRKQLQVIAKKNEVVCIFPEQSIL